MRTHHTDPDHPTETTIEIEGLQRPLTLFHLTDSHMALADERDPEAVPTAASTSARFAERTPGGVETRQLFDAAMAKAAAAQVDCALLTGDIIHFPARAGLAVVRRAVEGLGRPYLYTLGNHDWHFPHLEWGETTRRQFYPRFYPLTGGNPAAQAVEIGGVRLLALDNSNYQLDAHQVDFLRRHLASGKPCLLFCHIPFALDSLAPAVVEKWQAPIVMGDRSWTAAQREKWRVRDNDPSTLDAVGLLGEETGLAGIFCGHVHFSHGDRFGDNGCQYVTAPGFEGGYRIIRLRPRG